MDVKEAEEWMNKVKEIFDEEWDKYQKKVEKINVQISILNEEKTILWMKTLEIVSERAKQGLRK